MKFFHSITLCLTFLALSTVARSEVTPAPQVLATEAERVKVVKRASTAAVAIFEGSGQGGGSGVIISPDGFALTNFHVVAPCGAAMKCGLNDGQLYDAVVVGIDPVGDVALIQLLGRDDFPTAELGDSDKVRVGDWAFAIGNPFLLADDFTPSVSYGLISGVHRYQYPAGTLLEYADCLQTDAAINPGNSGGPLFDADGKLIGVNGRGSFEKRGRVNVGVGYAISINQIKRFLSHLKAGRIVDHASLGFTVSTGEIGRVVVDDILETSDAYRRGLRYGDEIVEFAGREITTANALKTALGTFPRDWVTTLTFRRDGQNQQVSLRLPGVHDPAQLIDMIQEQKEKPLDPPDKPKTKPDDPLDEPQEDEEKKPGPGILPDLQKLLKREPAMPAEVKSRYEEVRGYANYWYNRARQQELWDHFRDANSLEQMGATWQIAGKVDAEEFSLKIGPDRAEMRLPTVKSVALFAGELDTQLSPPGSGGLLVALHLWQRMLDKGLQKFGEVFYLGQLPLGASGEMVDCLVGFHTGMEFRLLFSPENGDLVGLEMFPGDDFDPCVVHFSEYADVAGRRLPMRWQVQHGVKPFADLHLTSWQIDTGTPPATKAAN
ncbi:MAG: trypsin-like peptidase domain-containing protein [Bythopirellula sp.]|nr:trypsin-like peptidase domain-containing protein [Bythopirellula sp.]